MTDFVRPIPAPQDVAAFWAALQVRYGTRLLDRRDSDDMKLVASALDAMGIVDRQRFMEDFVTTIGRKIWAPFVPGVVSGGWDLWTQVRIAVHEHLHVWLDDQLPGLEYEFRYATSSSHRAHTEATCYRADAVILWRYRREVLDPGGIAASLRDSYNCDDVDAEMAAQFLRASLQAIREGALPGPVIQFSCAWLDRRWNWREVPS